MRVIYLDQNHWIGLARIANGKDPDPARIATLDLVRTLVKQGLCIQAASHGPALPPYTLCEACKVRQDVKNAKYNKLRSIRKSHGES